MGYLPYQLVSRISAINHMGVSSQEAKSCAIFFQCEGPRLTTLDIQIIMMKQGNNISRNSMSTDQIMPSCSEITLQILSGYLVSFVF